MGVALPGAPGGKQGRGEETDLGHSARRQKADGEGESPDLISPTDFKHRGGSRSEGTLVSLAGGAMGGQG